METWAQFWGRRMSTAARLVEVGQFEWHHSYTEKLLFPSTFVHLFLSFLSPPDFFFTLIS